MTEPNPMVTVGWGDQDKQMIEYWCYERICDLKRDGNKKLATCIAVIQDFIGVKHDEQLEGAVEDKMLKHLKEHYGDFGLKELDYAFDLAAAKKLEGLNYEYRENLPYGGFNAIYVGTVLGAYRKMRSKVILKYQIAESDYIKRLSAIPVVGGETPITATPEADAEKRDKILADFCFAAWDCWDSGTTIMKADWVYDFLLKKKVMPEYAPDRMKTFKEYAETAISLRQKSGHVRGFSKSVGNVISDGGLAAQLATQTLETEIKKVAVITYFQSLKQMGTNLKEDFKFKTEFQP